MNDPTQRARSAGGSVDRSWARSASDDVPGPVAGGVAGEPSSARDQAASR